MNRDEKIKSIRPTLILADRGKKPLELFQNQTLRPILKLQHHLSLSLLRSHKNYKPNHMSNASRQQYEIFLKKYIQTNIDVKNQLLGIIIGLFTEIEMSFYKSNRKELNKRMIQMQLKRLVDAAYAGPA